MLFSLVVLRGPVRRGLREGCREGFADGRALKILAQRNGLIVGVDYAEAFEILRLIKI